MILDLNTGFINAYNSNPGERLFHYTSSEGLIGILKQKAIWATNTEFLNDRNEIKQAESIAKMLINNIIRLNKLNENEIELLNRMSVQLGSVSRRFYVCSFSENGDSLSQWRAYTTNSPGYAIGFPSNQLQNMAKEQSFNLVKCIYNTSTQIEICSKIINYYLNDFRKSIENNDLEKTIKNLSMDFARSIAHIGLIMKNDAFQEESEWRLVSKSIDEINNENIEFRVGKYGVVPYYNFNLVNEKYPNLANPNGVSLILRVGPAAEHTSAHMSAQFILGRYLGNNCGHGPSTIPYKNWK